MLLDPETFDLVQHIDTVLARGDGRTRVLGARQPRADAVRDRGRDAGVPQPGRRRDAAAAAARVRHRSRAAGRPARRLGGHASVQPVRAPADHRARPLPPPRRPAAVRRAPRADLRDAHPRRGRRPRQGDPGRQRPAPAPGAAARALGELAVLARRADRARVVAADGLRRLPALRARRRASATTRTTRRSSASSSGPAASRTTRTSGGTSGRTRGSAPSRCASATPSRTSRTPSRSRPTARRS